MKKMYFVNIKANGWVGWNSVYATTKQEAKELLLKKIGEKAYSEILWDSLLTGKRAEAADAKMEKAFRGMFD